MEDEVDSGEADHECDHVSNTLVQVQRSPGPQLNGQDSDQAVVVVAAAAAAAVAQPPKVCNQDYWLDQVEIHWFDIHCFHNLSWEHYLGSRNSGCQGVLADQHNSGQKEGLVDPQLSSRSRYPMMWRRVMYCLLQVVCSE